MKNRGLKALIIVFFLLFLCAFLKVNSYGVGAVVYVNKAEADFDKVAETIQLREVTESEELIESNVIESKISSPGAKKFK